MGTPLKERIIKEVYFNLKSPAAFAGLQKILAEAKKRHPRISLQDVQNFLQKEKTYTLHKPVRRRFTRLRTIPSGLNTDWQCDLGIFDSLKRENDGYMYMLVCIDVLSRRMFAAPAKSKRSEDMIEAFEKIFRKSHIRPHKLYSDRGVEFQAKKMLDYFRKKDVLKHVMNSPYIHAGVVERANRTIKERLYKYFSQNNTTRWIDILDKLILAINNSVNRVTGVTPLSVTYENAKELLQKVYKNEEGVGRQPKFSAGDIVRISKHKGVFDKSYYPNYTDELFRVRTPKSTNPVHYKIEDLKGNLIEGVFYEPELVLTTQDTLYRVADILKTRTRKGIKEHLVSWVGYAESENSWIPASDIVG